jgi:hypothetical protein
MLENIFKNKSAWRTWGSAININATIMPEKYWICQRMECKHTTLHIYAICATHVQQKLPTSKAICKAASLPSKHWQIQDFSGLIMALILVVDPCSTGRFVLKNIL